MGLSATRYCEGDKVVCWPVEFVKMTARSEAESAMKEKLKTVVAPFPATVVCDARVEMVKRCPVYSDSLTGFYLLMRFRRILQIE